MFFFRFLNGILELLQVQGAKICLKIIVKKTKLLRLGISQGEKVMLGNKRYIKWTVSLDLVVGKDNSAA
jgi:hypothetical protein